jgi:hypothetical protein
MTTAIMPAVSLNSDGFYTLRELMQAIEDGCGALYSDPANYGQILLFKETKHFPEASFDYYTIQWGDDPEEMRSWTRLDAHFDRLSYRIDACGWQFVAREDLERLKLAAQDESVPHSF